jgi:hypothetical protein
MLRYLFTRWNVLLWREYSCSFQQIQWVIIGC